MTNANDHFGNKNSASRLYQDPLGQILYTQGIKELCEKCQCYWLIDAILGHQTNPKLKSEDFQVWLLERQDKNSFSLSCRDANYKFLFSEEIHSLNFPFDMATLWLVEGFLMLPIEY